MSCRSKRVDKTPRENADSTVTLLIADLVIKSSCSYLLLSSNPMWPVFGILAAMAASFAARDTKVVFIDASGTAKKGISHA
jgi:hypothetical protein